MFTNYRFQLLNLILLLYIVSHTGVNCNDKPSPNDSSYHIYQVDDNLFDFSEPNTLGLNYIKGAETFTIYSPTIKSENNYNHGVVLFPFKEYIFAQWQSSCQDEDADDTHVLYSRSKDGKNWEMPKILAPVCKEGNYTSGGWWSNEDTLIAFINFWPKIEELPRGGYVLYKLSADGINWSEAKRILDINSKYVDGIFEQDPHILNNGRIINAVHEQPGLILAPFYTDDPKAISGWTKGIIENLRYKKFMSREIESSFFTRSDNAIVMVTRDQGNSFKQLASISIDNCVTWSKPIVTNMPDSRSKQSAGNLQSGTVYLVNNPSGSKNRFPLVITLSDDGFIFDRAFLLKAGGKDLQSMRFKGKYKSRGFSYPKSVIWKDFIFIGYATNKEDVEVTRIPIKNLE